MTQAALANPSPPPLRAFGRRLAPRRLPLCPEIRLWLLAQEIDLEEECHNLRDCDPPPYWAFCWGSGQALGRYILDHPEEVRGRHVIDFGAGGGIAGIAAAIAGAHSVVAVDLDPEALLAIEANASLNDVHLEAGSRIPDAWNVLLASDVLYEPSNGEWLHSLPSPSRSVIISDPERPSSPRLSIEPDFRCEVRTLPDVDSPSSSAAVFRLPSRAGCS